MKNTDNTYVEDVMIWKMQLVRFWQVVCFPYSYVELLFLYSRDHVVVVWLGLANTYVHDARRVPMQSKGHSFS